MSILKKRKNLMNALSWATVLLWMMLIFHLSSQVADQSNQISKDVTKVIVETVEKVVPEANFNLDTFNHFVRKNAHFFAYLSLAIFVMYALHRRKITEVNIIIMTFGICALYAVSDEFHQLYVPGRSGQVKDVLIDSSGAVVGIVFFLLFNRKKRQ